MIAYVQGKIAQSWNNSCLVLTQGGVGYRISLPAHTLAALPEEGEQAAFYTCLAVREDALELFGFATFEERQTFEILRAINKIGARTALAILSVYRPEDLREIILDENIAALTKVPGIGQKTAQHVYLELKYRLGSLSRSGAPANSVQPGGVYADAAAALANLGYAEDEYAPIARKILKEEPDLDAGGAIRMVLKEMAKRRA